MPMRILLFLIGAGLAGWVLYDVFVNAGNPLATDNISVRLIAAGFCMLIAVRKPSKREAGEETPPN